MDHRAANLREDENMSYAFAKKNRDNSQ